MRILLYVLRDFCVFLIMDHQVFSSILAVNKMESMFGIISPCKFTLSNQIKNTHHSSLTASYRNMVHFIYMMMRWENDLSGG